MKIKYKILLPLILAVFGTRTAFSAPAKKIDVDLTKLSSVVVFAQVFNMLIEPENYEGKTVCMKGNFLPVMSEADGKIHCCCVIKDATACCQEGIEFVWKGSHAYPAGYPKEGTVITVTGIFEKYNRDGYDSIRLVCEEDGVLF